MATPAVGTSTGGVRPVRTAGRLGSEEFHSAPLPIAQEAAILYSAGHSNAAVSLLKDEIKDATGRSNKQAWLMLFDLYQLAQNKEDYEALSMLFTVKFEQSPPAWTDSGDQGADPRRGASRDRKDFFALKPGPDGDLAAEIAKFGAFADEQGSVRLDVGKVTAVSAADATLLAAALARLRRKRTPMWFNNFDALEKLLRAAFNERATEDQRPYWLLLFELMILQGKSSEFEELGLEYAVAFEMSPPNWEVYLNTVSAASAAATAPAAGSPTLAPIAGFELKGVLSSASANQVGELNGYASTRPEVVVDMSGVLRIEFAFTSAFFDAVKAIQLAGKRVILANINEVNAALLEALGVNRYAILVRRKST
ncbi:MAG TPA: STAS domain-containing protein [Usitatibacter sp.]|nr:STAS domain-containing protein [Usitatibacter sp.]